METVVEIHIQGWRNPAHSIMMHVINLVEYYLLFTVLFVMISIFTDRGYPTKRALRAMLAHGR